MQLATQLAIEKNIVYTTNVISRNLMPHFLAACDICAAPSRLEGFGMIQVEAGRAASRLWGVSPCSIALRIRVTSLMLVLGPGCPNSQCTACLSAYMYLLLDAK